MNRVLDDNVPVEGSLTWFGGRVISYTPSKGSFILQIKKGKGSWVSVMRLGTPGAIMSSFEKVQAFDGQEKRIAFQTHDGRLHTILRG